MDRRIQHEIDRLCVRVKTGGDPEMAFAELSGFILGLVLSECQQEKDKYIGGVITTEDPILNCIKRIISLAEKKD